MMNSPTTGIAVVMLAGVSNGSFPAPSKGITEWKWEHVWIVYSFCAMGLLPISLAAVSGFGVVTGLLSANPMVAFKVGIYGALWGLGSVLFGISLVRLGMAITNALISGIVVFFGSLGPVLIGAIHMDPRRLIWLAGGLTLLILSLVVCASASIARDRNRAQDARTSSAGWKVRSIIGVLIAVASGLLSSMLNFGFVAGASLAEGALAKGFPPVLASVVIWVPALFGGLLLNMGYPAYLISRNRSWGILFRAPIRLGYWLRASMMGVLWFGAIQLYGFGASVMGRDGAVYGWALIVAVSILTSNAWGALTGEWRECGAKPKLLMWLATALLICSFAILVAQQMWS
jgi:L-rhamnose-H+ transport protein